MSDFPPPGYIATTSQVPGIDVYMPAPIALEHRQIVSFACPQCGGQQAYSIGDGGLVCVQCGYQQESTTLTPSTQAASFEFTLQTMQRVEQGWGYDRKQLSCRRCGAQTSVPADSLTHTCPFCGSHQVIQREDPQENLRPRFLIPFRVEDEDCQAIVAKWLGSSRWVPRNLRSLAARARFQAVYLPYWTISATTGANWKAEVRKTQRVGGKTRVIWRWESGQDHRRFRDLLIPGSQRISKRFHREAADFELDALVPYKPDFLAGIQAHAYEITLDHAWREARRSMRSTVREACRLQTSSRHIRNFTISLAYDEERWRYILLPVYIASYEHANRTYQVLINGQTGQLSGQRPADWTKIILVALAMVSPPLLLAILPQLAFPVSRMTVLLSGLGVLGFIIALVVIITILFSALRLDDD